MYIRHIRKFVQRHPTVVGFNPCECVSIPRTVRVPKNIVQNDGFNICRLVFLDNPAHLLGELELKRRKFIGLEVGLSAAVLVFLATSACAVGTRSNRLASDSILTASSIDVFAKSRDELRQIGIP
jgi:hypothetical protein